MARCSSEDDERHPHGHQSDQVLRVGASISRRDWTCSRGGAQGSDNTYDCDARWVLGNSLRGADYPNHPCLYDFCADPNRTAECEHCLYYCRTFQSTQISFCNPSHGGNAMDSGSDWHNQNEKISWPARTEGICCEWRRSSKR